MPENTLAVIIVIILAPVLCHLCRRSAMCCPAAGEDEDGTCPPAPPGSSASPASPTSPTSPGQPGRPGQPHASSCDAPGQGKHAEDDARPHPTDLTLFDDLPVGVFRSSLDGSRLLYVNNHLASIFGWQTPSDMLADQSPLDFYPSPAIREGLIARLKQEHRLTTGILDMRREGHEARHCILHLKLLPGSSVIEGWVMEATELARKKTALHDANRFLQNIVDGLPCPLFFKDTTGTYKLINRAFAAMLGVTVEELQDRTVRDIAPTEYADLYDEMDAVLLKAQGTASQRYESSFPTPDGIRHVLFDKATVADEEGMLQGIVGLITDITLRRESEEALRRAEARIRALVRNATDGIFSATPEGCLIEANPAMRSLLGLRATGQPEGDAGDDGAPAAPDATFRIEEQAFSLREGIVDGPGAWDEAMCALREGQHPPPLEVHMRRADGQTLWLALALWPVRQPNGDAEGPLPLEGMAHDISPHKQAEMDLERRVVTDALTGLYNRAHMEDILPRLLQRAAANNRTLGLLFLDLDGFKNVNDTYGHAVGDALLQQVADRLRNRLRHTDIAIRLGGDEFAILLWDVPGKEAVKGIGASILDAMMSEFCCADVPCVVSASIGASLYPHHASDAANLLRLADAAMYRAKADGKNRMAFADQETTRNPD